MQMTAIPDWVIAELLALAMSKATKMIPRQTGPLKALADQIATLVTENKLLKDLVDRLQRPEPQPADTTVFSFGPDNSYTLYIPTLPKNRHACQAHSAQLPLPFSG
jgi:hypothetical protein